MKNNLKLLILGVCSVLLVVQNASAQVCDETAFDLCIDTAIDTCAASNPDCTAGDRVVSLSDIQANVEAACCSKPNKGARKGCLTSHRAAFIGSKKLKAALGADLVTEIKDLIAALKQSDCGNDD